MSKYNWRKNLKKDRLKGLTPDVVYIDEAAAFDRSDWQQLMESFTQREMRPDTMIMHPQASTDIMMAQAQETVTRELRQALMDNRGNPVDRGIRSAHDAMENLRRNGTIDSFQIERSRPDVNYEHTFNVSIGLRERINTINITLGV